MVQMEKGGWSSDVGSCEFLFLFDCEEIVIGSSSSSGCEICIKRKD